MNRATLQSRAVPASDNVVELLTTQQYLRPHQPVREVLRMAMDQLGCCPGAIERALAWLQVDASQPIGRMRRSKLIQLGKSISRFWRQATPTEAPAANSPR